MTIGEMIEAYANFDKTREFYNLYKESVTVDLKVRYALTESYMQESSIDAILEGGDLWASIKEWGVKAWEAIKKFFKNIWFHITRFFHSIFSRSDKWYKADAAYKKIIKDSYALAVRRTRDRRKNPSEFFEEAVLKVAEKHGFYNAGANRISDKMPQDVIKKIEFLSKVSSGAKPDFDPEKYGEKLKNLAGRGDDNFVSRDAKTLIALLADTNTYINYAYDAGIGFKVDDKKIDPICEILGEKKINDKIESIADILNMTYMVGKPPLNVQVPESFDIAIRKTEVLISKVKNLISHASGTDKFNVELSKVMSDFEKAIERSKNYFVDIIVDERFNKKLTDTKRELDKVFDEVTGIAKATVNKSVYDNDHLTLDEPDRKRRGGMVSDFGRDGISSLGSELRDGILDSSASTTPLVLGRISSMFAGVTAGITLLTKAINWVHTFRKNFAEGVQTLLSADTVAPK